MSEEVKIPGPRPDCDLCKQLGTEEPPKAMYDGATIMGPWAYMCEYHFRKCGVGLGTGRGQKLIIEDELLIEEQ
jgi:hypothetical protein